ncbi:PAN2-PAN3 deadenylation complex catalytic subunit PAN2-like [Lingula anatina]|uniref:PAN2-PAN3 deadenylation complex catalytic subunit PAN2 n=1 Tax=Lingula anatina TaxID=7574 RepID=A0A2R2MRI6_LINAN|nr:PAN2-PAN3 deadenylation complex catalytic subunit PAN2-like [Lingula anatina]|eukprot:XP_023932627.1 PAN2-PAN3 deadenylation complex catalytic subunit PAN2-like [Lingula anatina]
MEFHPTIPPGDLPPAETAVEGYHDSSLQGDLGLYGDQLPGSMEHEYKEFHSILVDGGSHFGVSAVAFDGQEELLWMGNQGGHVTSYYGQGMQKYTSFQVDARFDVRQLLTLDTGVLSLMRNHLRCSHRFGRTLFDYGDERLQDMQCMLQTGGDKLLLGGHQTKMLELDLNSVQVVKEVDVEEAGCAIMRQTNKYLFSGDTSGKVTLRDPRTLKSEHVLEAHTGTLSDMDVHENLLITCGFTSRNNMGNMAVDRFLKVYDLRMLRAVTPIQLMIDPMFLRFMPTYSTRIAVISQAGQFQLTDTGAVTPASLFMYQVHTEGAGIMAFDVSTSCQTMAFGDSAGILHLYATGEHAVYNTFSRPTEFADQPRPLQPISITDELTPYAIIPMPYPDSSQKLLSDWPEHLCQRVYRKTQNIDNEILRSIMTRDNMGYAPNPGIKQRNQVPYKVNTGTTKGRHRKPSVPESPLGRGDDPFVSVPKTYQKVEVKYSKHGWEDFDFRHYNKTNFAGLETHIPNAYCNAMLQVLYFIEPLRCVLESHLCLKEFCLSCELGFLFHMLDKQKGQTCQASNFLRAFRTIPEASALGLILNDNEESSAKTNFSRLIQSWSRFIAQQLHTETSQKTKTKIAEIIEKEERRQQEEHEHEQTADEGTTEATPTVEEATEAQPSAELSADEEKEKENEKAEEKVEVTRSGEISPQTTIPGRLFYTEVISSFKCRCGLSSSRAGTSTLCNLTYPEIDDSKGLVQYTFADVLRHSMVSEQNTQAWCNTCSRYQPHVQTKVLKNLPDVLGVNCKLDNERDLEFWSTQKMLLKRRQEEMEARNPDLQMAAAYAAAMQRKPCRYGAACTRKDCHFWHNDPEKDKIEIKKSEDEPGWIPFLLKMRLTPEGSVEVEEQEVTEERFIPEPGYTYYDLLATVAHVKDAKTGGNLVSHVKVGETYHQRKEGVTCTQWYLFNDFSITPIEEQEAVQFNLEWKFPCLIYFIRKDLNQHYDIQIKNPVSSDVLFADASLVNPKRRKITYSPLSLDELPQKGDLVGLDAEFVSLNQEEAELRSDGTRSTIKPSQMSAARITCIRGQGEGEGEPFIDDYIATQEQVVDYLTQFSGIKPGDLDVTVSSKHLTTLKSAYIKLRYLVDTGVVFVGHGLKKDFRVINLVVPKDQIVDTVHLFHLPRQRMISLKFLAWYFLGKCCSTNL